MKTSWKLSFVTITGTGMTNDNPFVPPSLLLSTCLPISILTAIRRPVGETPGGLATAIVSKLGSSFKR